MISRYFTSSSMSKNKIELILLYHLYLYYDLPNRTSEQ